MSVGLVTYDHTGQCVLANNAASSLLGISTDELLGENYNDLPSWRESGLLAMARDVMATGADAHGEFRLTTSLGKGIWGWCSMSRFEQKRKPFLLLAFQDVSQLKNTEYDLRLTQELLRQFLEHTPVYTYIKDAESRPALLSRNFETFFNLPLDQMLGREMAELLPPETALRVVQEDRKVLETGGVFQEDDEIEGRHYSTTKFAIHLESGNYTGGFIFDVTERKLSEMRNRELAEQFRVLAEAVTDAVLILDDTGHILDVNSRACEWYGYTREELLQCSVADLEPESPPEAGCVRLDGILSEGACRRRVIQKRKDGGCLYGEAQALPIPETGKTLVIITP